MDMAQYIWRPLREMKQLNSKKIEFNLLTAKSIPRRKL